MPTYVSPFTGTVVTQTQVSYLNLSISSNTQLYWPSNTPANGYTLARILDVSTATTALSVFLPPANEGTVGADSLIRNTGVDAVTVLNNDSSQSQVIQPGQAWYFYLSDNTTVGGVWQQIQFGTGTSAADANSLAGNGLSVAAGKLQVAQTVVDTLTQPVITNTDVTKTYNWIAGNGTLLMPNTSTLSNGWFINFRNNGTGNLVLQPQGVATINGETSVTTYPGDSGTIMLDTSTGIPRFITVGLAAPVTSAFTSATYDVDSVIGPTLSLTNFAPIIQTYVALSGVRTTNLAVELPPITQLYIIVNDSSSGYSLSFNVTGSVYPAITVPFGTISTVLSDGNQLFIISQTITGTFFANNGTAANPSYTFTSDTSTGMYLQGAAVLGFSANGTQMLAIDKSISGSPVVNSLVRLNATLISGGTF
jgi:hypothetical protein